MHSLTRPAVVTALILAAACGQQPDAVTAPDGDLASPPGLSGPTPSFLIQEGSRYERLARRVARALADPEFRRDVYDALQQSNLREGKVYLQRFLGGPSRSGRGTRQHALGVTSGEQDADVAADLDGQAPMEIYFPVPAHRAAWDGGPDLLVATALRDGDAPAAYDLKGRRRVLDPKTPPRTPVLALVRAEQSFDRPLGLLEGGDGGENCLVECTPVEGTASVVVVPGLHMIATQFTETFEGWLKGSPEFEVHIMGQTGTSDSLEVLQCAGEHAGGPYVFDQNGKSWSGDVLLMSQTQLDTYKAQHPGQALRIMIFEDDDTSCVPKLDGDRVSQALADIDAFYRGFGSARDSILSGLSGQRIIKAAKSGQKVLEKVWSFITTKDEFVGAAVEDVAASFFLPNGNWIVKGEQLKSNGGIVLQMKGTVQ